MWAFSVIANTQHPSHDLQAEENLKEKLQAINSQMGLSLLAQESSLPTFVETQLGQSQTGSFCSYQLSHTEANFTATIDISSIPRLINSTPTELTYPRVSFVYNGHICAS